MHLSPRLVCSGGPEGPVLPFVDPSAPQAIPAGCVRRTGIPLQVCISPSEPSRTDTVQDQGGRESDPACGAMLAHSDLVPRVEAPRDIPLQQIPLR